MTAQKPDVVLHPPGVVQVAAAGGEMAVPEQRHFLQQRVRRLHHPAQPPGPQPSSEPPAMFSDSSQRRLNALDVGLRPQQLVHCSLRPVGQCLLKLLPAVAERRSAGTGVRPGPGSTAAGHPADMPPTPSRDRRGPGSRRRADSLGSIGVAHMPYSFKFNLIVNVASVSPWFVPRLSLT